ncbi:TadE/TadG family type IV pilus assembly protein [Candidatus Omnitrophota bacterium]
MRKNTRAQAIIEVALIAPICVLLLLGTVDLLRACYLQQVLNRAARASVRRAIVEPDVTSGSVPEDLIRAEAVRILGVAKLREDEVGIDIKIPGYNYLVGQADLTTDPIIVTVEHDFYSFLTNILRPENRTDKLLTLQGVAAGYYEDVGTLIDMRTLEREYPEIFAPPVLPENPPDGQVIEPPPPPPDRDGDGVRDSRDAFPDDPNESRDNDRDGIGNNADPDDDNDGLPDGQDPSRYDPDIDNDGILDGDDDDMDNDGIPNDDDPNPGSYNAPIAEG